MFPRLEIGLIISFACGTAAADMVQVQPARLASPGSGVLSRISQSPRLGFGPGVVTDRDLGTSSSAAVHLDGNMVYYSSLRVPPILAGGGGGAPAGGGYTNPGDNGVVTGGGGGGSSGGSNNGSNGGSRPKDPKTPAPGALVLGIIGMLCVEQVRPKSRRAQPART